MKGLVQNLYNINLQGCVLWLDKEENIRYKYSGSNPDNLAQIKEDILANKQKFIALLKYNNLFQHISISKSNPYIYKLPEVEFELSYSQLRLKFLDQYNKGMNAYNIPLLYKLEKSIQINSLSKAIMDIIARHEILRTLIITNEMGNWVQSVLSMDNLKFEITNIVVDDIQTLKSKIKEFSKKLFILNEEIPIKIFIFNNNDDKYLFLLVHHIAFDGWSVDLFLSELEILYKKHLTNSTENLIELRIQYKDFAIWNRFHVETYKTNSINYWKNKLKGYEDLALSIDKQRPLQFDYIGKTIPFDLDATLSNELRILSKNWGVSLYTTLLSAYYIMLKYYTNQNDIVIGIPVANRNYPELEKLIGFFVNSVPIRMEINTLATIEKFVKDVGKELVNAQLHQELPFEQLVETLKIQPDISRNPIFQVMFILDNFGDKHHLERSRLLEPIDIEELACISQFEMSMVINDSSEILRCKINYATSLFREETIIRYIESYQNILQQISSLLYSGQSTILANLIHKKLMHEGKVLLEPLKPMVNVFEDKVEDCGDSIAIVHDRIHVTYSVLNNKANILGIYLLKNYMLSNTDSIAIYLDRSESIIITILGILKAGVSYIPIDPSYPIYRSKFIINNSNPKSIITSKKYQSKLTDLTEICTDNLESIIFDSKNTRQGNLNISQCLNSIAYTMYTSGTTGKPKGIQISNLSYISLVNSVKEKYFPRKPITTYSITNYVFDIFGLEFGIPLITGGTMVIGNIEFTNLDCRYYDFIQMTPSLCDAKLSEMQILDHTQLLIGGEELKKKLLNDLLSRKINVINMYGPVETCIWSSSKQYLAKDLNTKSDCVSIGETMSLEKFYVLGERMELLPMGAVGELYISGIGLGVGYIGMPSLTAERFIANPFCTSEEYKTGLYSRMYKTGDIVRYTVDGDLLYLGRKDLQVKIAGHRVELGEIENIIKEYGNITTCIVVLWDKISELNQQESDYLIAYYVSDTNYNSEDLILYLNKKLPNYMIPQNFVKVYSIPLTPHGKVDKRALPKLSKVKTNEYCGPRNYIEKTLITVWSTILGIEEDRIDISDNFFTIGGSSIKAIKLVNLINREFKSDISIKSLYEYRTISQLASLIECSSTNIFKYDQFQILKENNTDLYKPFLLSNVQQAYYFGRNNAYELSNVSTHIYIEYAFKYLNIPMLEQALNKIIKRHLALSLIFKNGTQRYYKNLETYFIKVNYNINNQDFLTLRNQLSQKLYDPAIFPLFDFQVSITNNLYILHISFDALIMDDSSFEIFLNEWSLLYQDINTILPKLDINFRDYLLRFDEIRNSQIYFDAKKYLSQKLSYYNFEMALPLKIQPYEIKAPVFKRVTKTIPNDIWKKIVKKSNETGISLTAILLEAFGQVLSFWTGQNRLCINLTLFNRLPLHKHVNDIIGDFTTLTLFDYINETNIAALDKFRLIHNSLLTDIENNIFDGVDAQRFLKQHQLIEKDKIIGQVVLTSTVGNISKQTSQILDKSYIGVNYSITQTSQVWLDNKAYETEDGFVAEWDYVEQLFDDYLIENMHDAYCKILEKISLIKWEQDPLPALDMPFFDIQLINALNSSKQGFLSENLFSECIKNVQKNSLEEKVAIIDLGLSIKYTYEQLLKESELLAEHIYSSKKNKLIAILCEKGYLQVLGTLAIMRSGGAYLPMDVEWPVSRITEILEQSSSSLLLMSKSQYHHIGSMIPKKYLVWVIEDLVDSLIHDKNLNLIDKTNILPKVAPGDMAYVIYTSGSTGSPKGVAIDHKGAVNTINAVNSVLKVSNRDTIFALSRLSFDLSVYDIYGILSVGGTIVFPDQYKINDQDHWVKAISENEITMWNTVPQLADLLIGSHIENDRLSSIRLFLLSGDWVPLNLFDRIKAILPNSEIVSLGGATEASIWSVWHKIKECKKYWKSVPYGFSMPNQTLHILNDNLIECPIGVVGEIYIGGIGVAIGYWQDNEKTNYSFIEHKKFGRIYKTGDLAKLDKNGYVEFLGRKDNQVKIGGYRIELGEITSKLSQIPGIKDPIVQLQKNHNKDSYLVGYLLHTPCSKTYKIGIDSTLQSLKSDTKKIYYPDTYNLHLDLNELEYQTRKSYREFSSADINLEELVRVYNHSSLYSKVNSQKQLKSILDLKEILSKLSAISHKFGAPKYLYPSAGNTYSVRTFINLPSEIDYIQPGYYYYNPISHTLCDCSQWNMKKKSDSIKIDLISFWPDIKNSYKDDYERFVYLELGHIVALIEEIGIKFKLEIVNTKLDHNNTHCISLIFHAQCSNLNLQALQLNYFNKKGEKFDIKYNPLSNIFEEDIFFDASHTGQLVNRGNIIISIDADSSLENYIGSGYLFQKYSTHLLAQNIGSCMLGITTSASSIYSMVIGYILPTHKTNYISNPAILPLKFFINKYLSDRLPAYMIPHDYIMLDQFPMSSNGKIELKKLPLLEFVADIEKIMPRNQFENDLAEIWSVILGLDANKISILDNFFVLGGNSILAMQMINKANKQLNISCTLKDIYKLQNIKNICTTFNVNKITEKRVIDSI